MFICATIFPRASPRPSPPLPPRLLPRLRCPLTCLLAAAVASWCPASQRHRAEARHRLWALLRLCTAWLLWQPRALLPFPAHSLCPVTALPCARRLPPSRAATALLAPAAAAAVPRRARVFKPSGLPPRNKPASSFPPLLRFHSSSTRCAARSLALLATLRALPACPPRLPVPCCARRRPPTSSGCKQGHPTWAAIHFNQPG